VFVICVVDPDPDYVSYNSVWFRFDVDVKKVYEYGEVKRSNTRAIRGSREHYNRV
jgi:hypothetical protein